RESSGHETADEETLVPFGGSSNPMAATSNGPSHSVTHHANRVVVEVISTMISSELVSSLVIFACATTCRVVDAPEGTYSSSTHVLPAVSLIVGAPAVACTTASDRTSVCPAGIVAGIGIGCGSAALSARPPPHSRTNATIRTP